MKDRDNDVLRTIKPVDLDFDSFTIPTELEIKDKGKSDWLAKSLVLIQTVWFVTQCVARAIEHLPITHLEIVTLAYAAMNFFIYMFWWNKPLNVDRPVRVYKSTIGDQETSKPRTQNRVSDWGMLDVKWIGLRIMGTQDDGVDLSQEDKVPMFWAADVGENQEAGVAAGITLAVGIIFGAIHCVA